MAKTIRNLALGMGRIALSAASSDGNGCKGEGTMKRIVLLFLMTAAIAAAQTVVPLLDCVVFNPTANELTAFFGYVNTDNSPVVIAVGVNNFFDPSPGFRGQPVTFS